MSELNELNASIMAFTELWEACKDDDQKEEILTQRDVLRRKARKLANKTLMDGSPELNEAITSLNELTEMAKTAKNDIEETVGKIKKFAKFIEDATNAITKVVSLLP